MPRRKKTRPDKKITGATRTGKPMHVPEPVIESLKFRVGKTDEPPKLEKTLRKMHAELQKTQKRNRKRQAQAKRRQQPKRQR